MMFGHSRRPRLRGMAVLLMLSSLSMLGTATWTTPTHVSATEDKVAEVESSELTETVENEAEFSKRDNYDAYIAEIGEKPFPAKAYTLQAAEYAKGESVEVLDAFEGVEGPVLSTDEVGFAEWKVDVEEEGLYQIRLNYRPVEGRGASIERALRINGKQPFFNAGHFTFSRMWTNKDHQPGDPFVQDNRGNDLRPSQVEVPFWREVWLEDYMGYYSDPYHFYLKAGENTIRLESVKEPMLIASIEIAQKDPAPSYAELSATYQAQPYQGEAIKIQGESARYRSDATLYPHNDRSSPMTEPYDVSKIRLNTIGGNAWNQPHQWITWEVDVPEDGLYKLGIKSRQNISRGVYSSRQLMIDGQIPFREAENLRFYFNADWNMYVLGQGDERNVKANDVEPYLVELKAGKHEITMQTILGEFSEVIRTVEDSLYTLNEAYRKIIMLTTTTPDIYRDYNLHRELPDVVKEFSRQSQILSATGDRLAEITGERGAQTAILSTLAYQLKEMNARPQDIPRMLSDFKTNIGALGTWILTASEKPLEIDYMVLTSPEETFPRTKANFFENMGHEVKAFFSSYFEDYSSVGNTYDGDTEPLTVWIQSGRDQAQVLKQLIDNSFTQEHNIPVNLQIIQVGTLLPATVANIGPDVALWMNGGEPVNFASRGAAADLSKYADFEEVARRFAPSAMVPYQYEGGTYALPETHTFPMLFYRKDILAELGLEVPETWDDMIDMLPVIQKNHLEFGIPVSLPAAPDNGMMSFFMFLYQEGGQLYKEQGSRSALDEEPAIEAFDRWTSLFLNYKLPQAYDFPNRFRIGEMPMGIADYQTYNQLSVFAPEIRGLWGMAPVPGHIDEKGELHREIGGWGQNAMMLEDSDQKDAGWTFLKWWTSTDVQEAFGREMESLLGSAARYPTANVEAMGRLPWPVEDYESLITQWEDVEGSPEVPGGYYTPRHLNNAFRAVVYNGDNPRETLLDYVRDINDELTSKRQEFGLPTYEDLKQAGAIDAAKEGATP